MRRREFITLLGSAAAWVSPARAQEPRKMIGVLSSFDLPGFFAEVLMPAFSQGLKDVGFVEGRNISIELRLADDHYDRLPSLAVGDHGIFEKQPHAKWRTCPILSDASLFSGSKIGDTSDS